MTRIIQVTSGAVVFLSVLLNASFAFASDHDSHNRSYNSHAYNYSYRNYDNSINHSFNNYDSGNMYYGGYNYGYGYPYTNYAYNTYSYGLYDYYNYANNGYYNNGYYNDYSYNHKPTCSISAWNTSGTNRYDDTVTVQWYSSYATSAYVSNIGSVNTSGSRVFPNPSDGSFTLTVYGPGGSTSCSVSNPHYNAFGDRRGHSYLYNYGAYYPSYMYPNYTTPIYYQAYAPGPVTLASAAVPLTHIPYTGFDYGPLGNSLYWLAIMAVAVAGAYLIVYHHSGLQPAAFAGEVAEAARNQLRLLRSIIR